MATFYQSQYISLAQPRNSYHSTHYFLIKFSEYNSHTDIGHKRKKNVQFRGLQILTSLVTLPVLCDDSCSVEVGGGRSVPPVAIIISTVGGGNVADGPDEVG